MIVSIWNQNNNDMSSAFQAVLSLAVVYTKPYTVTLLENTSGEKVLGDVMIDENYSNRIKENVVYQTIDTPESEVVRFVSEKYNKLIRGNNAIELINHALYYVPQQVDKRVDIYDRMLYRNLSSYISEAEERSDFTIINAADNASMSAGEILDKSKYIIVLMSFKCEEIRRFLNKYKPILYKCYFVFFDSVATYNSNARHCCCPFGIKPSRVFALPYSDVFKMHADSGRISEYFRRHFRCNSMSSEFRLVRGIMNITDEIFKRENRLW